MLIVTEYGYVWIIRDKPCSNLICLEGKNHQKKKIKG